MGNNMLDELKEDLVGIDIRFDEPLKGYTYTKVGGDRQEDLPGDIQILP